MTRKCYTYIVMKTELTSTIRRWPTLCVVNESAFEKAEPPSEWILVTVIVVGVGGRGA